MSLYDLSLKSLDGQAMPLSAFRGKVVLAVNVASECGFTRQYEGLQKLHAAFGDRGFSVIGFPCNQFGGQEPGGPEAIQAKLDVLKQHCDTLGRDYNTIEKTTLSTANLSPSGQTPAEIIAQCQALAKIGVQHVIFNMPNTQDITPLETFAKEIIPAVTAF